MSSALFCRHFTKNTDQAKEITEEDQDIEVELKYVSHDVVGQICEQYEKDVWTNKRKNQPLLRRVTGEAETTREITIVS